MTATASMCSISQRATSPFASVAPMLAVLAQDLPPDPRHYAFEFKWDGMRVLSLWDGRRLCLRSRNDLDATLRFPELQPLAKALGKRRMILDGEVVAFDDSGSPSFAKLQQRMHVSDARTAERLSHSIPVNYILFDILYLNDWLIAQPWTKRRRQLEKLNPKGPSWQTSPALIGEGEAMLETARRHHLEGIIAKRLDSKYEPGRRSPNWLKIKLVTRQEFVVGGWTAEKGSRHGLGSIQLGYYDRAKPPKFHYAGSAGSGFTNQSATEMLRRLGPLEIPKSPFVEKVPRADVHYVRPQVVVEVEYRRWPPGGLVQQTTFQGVRTDKSPRQVVREDHSCTEV